MIQQSHLWAYSQKKIESSKSEGCLHTSVHSSIIHDSQYVETTQTTIAGWTDKPNVVHTYYGILFGLKKEENSDIF